MTIVFKVKNNKHVVFSDANENMNQINFFAKSKFVVQFSKKFQCD